MRTPNPRVALPILLAAIGGAAVGYFITATSCGPGSCLVAAIGMAVLVGLVAAIGVGTVVILAVRSFAEWRVHTERDVLVMEEERAGPNVTPSVGEDAATYWEASSGARHNPGRKSRPERTRPSPAEDTPYGGGDLDQP